MVSISPADPANVAPRSPARPGGWRWFARQPECVLVVFVSLSLALWVSGNGIPYGYDAIEVYYTYLIGFNGATFSNVNPLMADLAVSPDLAAHPYYYTHHPNLFAHGLSQILIRAGIANIPAHNLFAIGIATFGLFVAARVLRRLGGARLATVALLIFSLHYVGVLTWSNHLLRAMAFPLFWLNVYAVLRFAEKPSPWRLVWPSVATFAVFLNDLTLGPYFLAVVVLLGWQARLSLRTKGIFTAVCGIGACAALGMWLTILVSTLGWDVVRQDITYTYLGRNATESISSQSAVAGFYRDHNIVFWGSFVPTEDRVGLIGQAYSTAFTLGHGLLALLIYPIGLGILVGTPLSWISTRVGLLRGGGNRPITAVVVVAGAVGLWLASRSTGLLESWDLTGASRSVSVGAAILLIAGLVVVAARARPRSSPEGATAIQETASAVTLRNYLIAVTGATAIMTWGWFGGFTAGLVWGYKPGLIFLEDVVLAAVVLRLVTIFGCTSAARLYRAAAAATLVGIGTYWLAYQVKQIERYPPTELEIAQVARHDQSLQGTTFVAGTVHHIIWYYIGGTAHHIPGPDQNPIDTESYMFFSDWKARAETYRAPQYLLCARMHTQPKGACLAWLQALERAGLIIDHNYEAGADLDYLIFKFPDTYWQTRWNRAAS